MRARPVAPAADALEHRHPRSDEDLVTEFYLRGFGREPARQELSVWSQKLKSKDAKERSERCEDFVWSLLNSREFAENH